MLRVTGEQLFEIAVAGFVLRVDERLGRFFVRSGKIRATEKPAECDERGWAVGR
jgi:hypothetical protein